MVISKEDELKVPYLPMRFPQSDSLAGLQEFDNDLEQYLNEILAHAYDVARLWAVSFYDSNINVYSVSAMGREDILQHLVTEVFVKKYRGKVMDNPHDWNIKKFRASFYMACHNACRINRRFFLAQKRRSTASTVVRLDDPDSHVDHNEFQKPVSALSEWVEKLSDTTPLITRMAMLGMGGTYSTVSSISQRLKQAPLMSLQRDKIKAMVSRMKLSGHISSPRDPAHKLLDDLSDEHVPLVTEYLELLKKGHVGAFRPPTPQESVGRAANIQTGSAFWMALDFEILGDHFGVVLNHEVNPLIAWKVLRPKVESMASDTWQDVPEHVKTLIQAIRELAEGKQQESLSYAPIQSHRVKIKTVQVSCAENRISVSFGSARPSDAFSNLNASPAWPNFLALMGTAEVQVNSTSVVIQTDRARLLEESIIEARIHMVLDCVP